MFMYCQLLKETFLEMNHDEHAKRALVDICRKEYADNERGLCVINEFDRDYEKHSPTWWYTRDCFVYRMLNKALRTHDIEIINSFGFFINDLHRQREVLHRSLSPGNFTVYRGQTWVCSYFRLLTLTFSGFIFEINMADFSCSSMSIEEFDKLRGNVGGLISFNSFLSTSADKDVSQFFARSSLEHRDMKAILFVIDIDLALISCPVAYLGESLSYFSDEHEYLWGMNTIFRISRVKEDRNGLCHIHLTVTNEDDPQLRQLTEYMRQEAGRLSGIQRLGNLMIEMGEWTKAKDLYETLLQEEASLSTIQQLGFIAYRMNNPDEALRHYQRAVSIILTDSTSDSSSLATLHSNIGCVLIDQNRLSEARKRFQRALKLERKVEKPNKEYIVSIRFENVSTFDSALNLFKARYQNNIATIFEKQGRRKEALKIMESTLPVLRECLPPTHPDIAALYINIGTIYDKIGDPSSALENYQSCLHIQTASLPPHHSDLTRTKHYMKLSTARVQQRYGSARHVREYFILHISGYLLTIWKYEEMTKLVADVNRSVFSRFHKKLKQAVEIFIAKNETAVR